MPRTDTPEPASDASGPSERDPSRGSKLRQARRDTFRAADLTTIGLVFPVAALMGFWVGGVVGGWFGQEENGQLVGLGIGIVSGFYNVYKVWRRLVHEQEVEDAAARALRDGQGGDGSRPG